MLRIFIPFLMVGLLVVGCGSDDGSGGSTTTSHGPQAVGDAGDSDSGSSTTSAGEATDMEAVAEELGLLDACNAEREEVAIETVEAGASAEVVESDPISTVITEFALVESASEDERVGLFGFGSSEGIAWYCIYYGSTPEPDETWITEWDWFDGTTTVNGHDGSEFVD